MKCFRVSFNTLGPWFLHFFLWDHKKIAEFLAEHLTHLLFIDFNAVTNAKFYWLKYLKNTCN